MGDIHCDKLSYLLIYTYVTTLLYTAMGKKSSSKKQQQRSPKKQHIQQTNSVVNTVAQSQALQPKNILSGTNPQVQIRPASSRKLKSLDSAEHARSDIMRIAALLGVMAVILLALTVANAKSTLLHTAGKHLATSLRLQ